MKLEKDLHFHPFTDPSSGLMCGISARSLSRGKLAIFSVMIWKMEVCLKHFQMTSGWEGLQALGRIGSRFRVTLRNWRVHPDKREKQPPSASFAKKKSNF